MSYFFFTAVRVYFSACLWLALLKVSNKALEGLAVFCEIGHIEVDSKSLNNFASFELS